LGGALFGIDTANREPDLRLIAIDQQQVSVLAYQRQILLGRLLTQKERDRLVEDILVEEMLVHEAVTRGLHLTDARVRQRLAAKMYFLIDETPPEPAEADLERLRAADPEQYMTPELVTFEHLFFPNNRERAERALAGLLAGKSRAELNDPGEIFWLGERLEYYNESQLAVVLGSKFTAALRELLPGDWSGPIESGRGWHLVRLERFHPPEPLTGPVLREALVRDWEERFRQDVRAKKLAEMESGYRIVRPNPGGATSANAATVQ
jgi:hypothetical protein